MHVNNVGQSAGEEIDLGQAGADYGWPCREGAHPNVTTGKCSPTPPALVDPIWEYPHGTIPGTTATGCGSITGGVFVPAGAWTGYDGSYLYADFNCGAIARLVSLALVDMSPGAVTEDVVAAVAAVAPELEAFPADLFAQQQDWVKTFARFARTLALLGLAIAALGISNTLSMNVAERTGELGLLRALGWRRARIARLVIAEGLLLSVGGAALGFPAAAAILRFLTRGGLLGVIPARLPAASVAEGIATVLAAGLLASLPPLVHALRIRPARALREL